MVNWTHNIPDVLSIFTTICVLTLQTLCYKYDWKRRIEQMTNKKARPRTYLMVLLIIACLILNILSVFIQLFVHYAFPNCDICDIGHIIYRLLYATIWSLNLLFFVQRAYLCQYLTPVLTDKWADKILPLMILAIYITFVSTIIGNALIESTHNINANINATCIEASDPSHPTNYGCVDSFGFNGIGLSYIGGTILGTSIHLIILFLFLKPLFMIHNIPNKVFSNSQLTSVWSLDPAYFWYMPSVDNMMNSLSLFLMIGTNRKWCIKMSYYVLEVFCCKAIAYKNQNNLTNFAEQGKDGTLQSFQDQTKIRLGRQLSPNISPITPEQTPALMNNDSDIEVKYKSQKSIAANAVGSPWSSDKYNLDVEYATYAKKHTLHSQTEPNTNQSNASFLHAPSHDTPKSTGMFDDGSSFPEPTITKLFTVSPVSQHEEVLSDSERDDHI